MAYEAVVTEVEGLPDKDIALVIDYIKYLKFRAKMNASDMTDSGKNRKYPNRQLGLMKGKIKLLPGFDDIPEG